MTLLEQRVNWTRVRPLTDMLVFNFFFFYVSSGILSFYKNLLWDIKI